MQIRGKTEVEKVPDFFIDYDYGETSRYKVLGIIGEGSSGVVCAATDTATGEKVAIKKMTYIFDDASSGIKTLRKLRLLRLLRHPDIAEIKRILVPPKRVFRDIYVVYDLMDSDLLRVIKHNDNITHEHHRAFLYQILSALKYMHTANVHLGDLKPNNILANVNNRLKICGLGQARVSFNNSPTAVYSMDCVATSWYSAPELCGSFFDKYTSAADIWSTGCIFAEVLTRKPLFPGEDDTDQLKLITDLLGTPPPDFISRIHNDEAKKFLTNMRRKRPVLFSRKFPKSDPAAIRLLQRLLAFDPKDRPTAEQALADPYFKGLANIEREPSSKPISRFEFPSENHNLTKQEIRELVYREILDYNPEFRVFRYFSRYSKTSVVYSDKGPFETQFVNVEDNGSRSGTVVPPPGRYISLPWPTVNSSTISPKPIQDLAAVGHRQMTEDPHDNDSKVMELTSQNLSNALQPPHYMPGRSAGPVLLDEDGGKNATGANSQKEAPSISPRYAVGSSMVVNQETTETYCKRDTSQVRQLPKKSKVGQIPPKPTGRQLRPRPAARNVSSTMLVDSDTDPNNQQQDPAARPHI